MKLNDVENYEIVYRLHASKRMFEREISDDDVEYLLKNGEIIERYDEDYPLPSLLLNGFSINKRPLHLVVAVNREEKRLIIVTVYEPNTLKWLDNFSRRK
ncbi:MAG: DUF4258 domain-containing protein [Methylococcales bacterium]|nr:DUF4258 domain-containing protein [Methylococcales bacterium]